MINIRKTKLEDIDTELASYAKARYFMRSYGNTSQWTNGYPSKELVMQDIQNGNSYVSFAQGELVALFSLIYGEDLNYRDVSGGAWLNNLPYATVHRIAVNAQGKGAGSFCLSYLSFA